MSAVLKAPFPYFGGKKGAAALIWSRFGDVPNYVEPFAGSLAVLLGRPTSPRIETVNDADGLLSNAWRAIRLDPDAVAFYSNVPVSELDLHAYHVTLVHARADLTARLMADPEYHDARLAGYWIFGACNWIGSGWCDGSGPWVLRDGMLVNRREVGEHSGVFRKLPHLGDAGVGVSRRIPHLGDAGAGAPADACIEQADSNPGLYAWMNDLSKRLRRVRITCGDWTRVTGESVTTKNGMTAVLLDPPYDAEGADNDVYGVTYDASVSAAALKWAIENGENPLLRIAFCGYDLIAPDGWTAEPWKAKKGYARVNEEGGHNGHREVILFSPRCLRPERSAQRGLFGGTQ